MANAKFDDKKFLEYLDRVMAGEYIPPSEIPDEKTRADLDFARAMLTSKEEPSPLYRAQLRQRLLSKLASASAYSAESSGNRLPSWLTAWNRPVWIAAATAVVAVIAVTTWWITSISSTGSIVMPKSALPPNVYAANLPDRIAPANVMFRSEQNLSGNTGTAAVYEVSVPVITLDRAAEIAANLGIHGQPAYSQDKSRISITDGTGVKERQLMIWPASGAVEYKYTDAAVLKSGSGLKLPSKHEAVQIGYAALDQAGLLPYGYDSEGKMEGLAGVINGGSYPKLNSATGQAGQSDAQYVIVDIPLLLNGLQAAGPGAKTEVLVGKGGEVIGFSSYIRDFTPRYSTQTISEKAAFQAVSGGGGSIDIPLNASEVVVKQVKLKYWLEPSAGKQSLVLPVYELQGTTLDKQGKTIEDFKGWTKAIY